MAPSIGWTERLPEGALPVYFLSAYQRLFAENDQADAVTIHLADDSGEWHLPLLLRDLGQGRREGYTAYGYGGLWSKSGNLISPELLVNLRRFLADEGIVGVLLRHSPFLANQDWLPHGETEFNRQTYSRSLASGSDLDAFCANAQQKLRWSINYARRNGLKTEFYPLAQCDEFLVREFHEIYLALMHGKGTDDYYHFSAEFFLKHVTLLGQHGEMAIVRDAAGGKMIAAAFFLLDETGWAHYHLSASRREFMKVQPVELMMAEALVRYGNAGYRSFHFGGGHAIDESDGLSRFKKKFSTETRSFNLSRWVCDDRQYQLERRRLPLKHPGFFLIGDARRGAA